jgi:hypothetical protein
VIPPYSIPVSLTARSIGRKDALRTSSRLRTAVFTSVRVVASTRQAAIRSAPSRLPATTTQFAEISAGTWYVWVKAAVSDRSGSISTTPIRSSSGNAFSAASTGAATRSRRSATGTGIRVPTVSGGMLRRPAAASAP